MLTCAECGYVSCTKGDKENAPKNCPMHDTETVNACLARYRENGHETFFQTAASIESAGYCQWPRLREVAEFCRAMKYRRVGIAFCVGLKNEAKIVADILRQFDLEVESIICKTGGVNKTALGIPKEQFLLPGEFEAMCNPIAQAEFLNKQKTDFNVVVGLCVGHDSLFFKYSSAPVTTLIAKDRVLAHNPAGAIYCSHSYLEKKVRPLEK